MDKCNGHHMYSGYGSSELFSGIAVDNINVDSNKDSNKDNSRDVIGVGIPYAGITLGVFDESGKELTYSISGELWIKSGSAMKCYYNKLELTANEIIRIHEDGRKWVHSGDIGYMDEDGNLLIVDRMKRMIIRHDGFKVFPSQIEKVIIKNKCVESCCVVGKSDKTHSQGKLPVAYIVLVDGNADKSTIKEQLRDLCAEELPEYAQPEDFIVIDKMPFTAIGKVDYKKLEKI